MKVDLVSNNINNKINFASGKVHVFSDFDKTYMPDSHSNFARNQNADFVNAMRRYFDDFRQFLDRTKEGLKFTITTGRTYAEFETMAEISRNRNFGMPLPDTLICKNGSDEYLKTGIDVDFYKGGYFPFDYKRPNLQKEEEIKKLTGWNGKKIKAKLTELFKKHDLKIVEAGSEHGEKDYGWRSLFAHNNLDNNNPNEWKVGFRLDGNCKMFYMLPADMNTNPERKNVLQDILQTMNRFFAENSMQVHTYTKQNANECNGRPYFIIEPKVDKTLCLNVFKHEESGLTKLFDTKFAVQKALINNDLVVVAGDSSNDRIMLNPINYMIEEFKKLNIDTTDISANSPKSLIKFLDKHPELYETYKNIPFVGIIEKHIKEGKWAERTTLDDLIQYFSEGKYKKIIVVENGKLKDGIKEAIKFYSEQNAQYKSELTEDLLKEVFNETRKQIKKNKPKHIITKCIITVVAILGLALGINYFSKHKSNTGNKHDKQI